MSGRFPMPDKGHGRPMHELAITESLVEAVTEHAGGSRVMRVSLEIGKLSGVVADSVRFCFDVCTRGTSLDGATLEIVEPPGRAFCRDCNREVEIEDFFALCACGSANLEVRGGRELRIREME